MLYIKKLLEKVQLHNESRQVWSDKVEGRNNVYFSSYQLQDMATKEKIQLVNELHRPIKRKFPRRRTIIKGVDDLWQADLGQMDLYARENKQFKYFLLVIDCFSKYIWIKPLKSKSGLEVSKAFAVILKESGRCPVHLHTDQGTEFYCHDFQKLMKSYKINHYSTFTHLKAAIAERAIRTIKEKLFKFFSLNSSFKWIDVLHKIVFNYNNQIHRTIKMKPRDVTRKNEKLLLNTAFNHIKMAIGKGKFEVGDIVRISKAKHIFEKGYTPNWTTELFKVVSIKITQPITYILEDLSGNPIRGAFYEYEMQKTKQPDVYLVEKILRRKGNKVYVKWLGFDNSHNSWIDKNNKL